MAESGLSQPPIRTITTERLVLTTTQMSDLDGVMDLITDNEIMKWTSQGPVENKDQGALWLSARALGPDVINFAIREKDHPERLIGLLGSFHRPNVGYFVHPDCKGKGYATEALLGFIPFYFEHVPTADEGGTGYDYIEGSTATNNFGSQRVLEKAGFERCETRWLEIQNRPTEVVYFRMPRPGKTLKELGLDAESLQHPADEPPEPPVQ